MRLEVPQRRKLVYEGRIPIRRGGMDAMGHVNTTTYFRSPATARIDWFLRRTGSRPAPG